ncbi:uncharacterized protein A1O5_11028 [Cladophialophora psammophila CBS 110553]|uniref:Alpha/beta hydrolase fold-3 domain-containing protein n=1 Tax=Cladophialophora psammophila CBS 110553 TaxID=1182543 RepID=W9WCF9_9EURO|nr:uncharacterized protein A1O5_11028 [Cladophialophora psammophila CBS 110553]EXJ65787.1 hypothetical protein A1O5_11028 [Cladophialophora psammophila CBS 110553]
MSRSQAHDERNRVVRGGMSSLEAAMSVSAPTRDIITSECARLGQTVKTEDIPDSEGAKVHWIGDSSAPSAILYFHGGGLGLPAMPGHIAFLVDTQQRLAKEGKPFSIAFVEYGLSPQHRFPTQYRQAVQALKTVLQSGRKPSDVIIGGDSAGGNLTLGILSATKHSHPGIPWLELASPLKGALLISPWVDLSVGTSKSWIENKDKDIVSTTIIPELVGNLVSDDERGEFSDPARADSKWWADTPVSSILALAGTHELFCDDIREVCHKLKEAGLNVEAVECPKQVHIDCMLDAQSGLEHGAMSHAIWDWLKKVL